MRIQLFEFEDLTWFPDIIRRGGTDFLRYFLHITHFYDPVIPLIIDTLEKTGETKIIDLCSGGGGPIEQVSNTLVSQGVLLSIFLTDKFPNTEAYQHIKDKNKGHIDFIKTSVDALNVPSSLKGFRTMFSAIHHFGPNTTKSIIKNAVENKAGIGVFDSGDKSIFTILGIIIFHPILFFFCTPFLGLLLSQDYFILI